jgi:hypothetical protein
MLAESRTLQLLVDRGRNWRKVCLVMFRVYIDDSGTAPSQKVAIATALIIPAARIIALEREWARLTEQEHFKAFHMSECVWRNPKSEFADWDCQKQARIISRVRQIGKKFGLKAFSLAINKDDYDELVSPNLEYADQYHYTWAMRNMIDLLDKWAKYSNVTVPFEYVYDWMDAKTQKEAKAEIETVMAQAEEDSIEKGQGSRYTNYSFRRRQDVPALQCTDALAWTCYQLALLAHRGTPWTPIAKASWNDYYEHQSRTWLYAMGMKRENLKVWVEREIADGKSLERFRRWKREH